MPSPFFSPQFFYARKSGDTLFLDNSLNLRSVSLNLTHCGGSKPLLIFALQIIGLISIL